MNAFIIIAVGEKRFFELALNCCLSIKTHEEIPVILIHDYTVLDERSCYFDQTIFVTISGKAQEKAMRAKLLAYDYVTEVANYEKYIILDADALILPDKKPSELFQSATEQAFSFASDKYRYGFVPYVNDIFDYETQKSQRDNANFWCDPMAAKAHFKLKFNLPQINASFIYFTRDSKKVFDTALEVWNDDTFEFKKFRGAKTEELCFNIAMAKLGIEPKQVPYRPIFFQCYSENLEEPYIQHNYRAMGLAGDIKHDLRIIDLYNRTANYYRDYFGLKDKFYFRPKEKKIRKVKHVEIKHTRRTLYRAGEVPNSDGGIFNPDSIIFQGKHIEIYRKEANYDLYAKRYSKTTAIPHLVTDGEHQELKIVGWDGLRLEDFRLFTLHKNLMCNHTVAYQDRRSNRASGQQYDRISVGISIIHDGAVVKMDTPKVSENLIEKNWVMWSEEGAIYLLYSISPFVLYKCSNFMLQGTKKWEEVKVKQPKFKWFHNKFICSSTNPIPIDRYLLVFFHTKQDGFYYHGALLMDKKTKVIKHQMQRPIKVDARSDGMAKSVQYLSGSVYFEKDGIVRCYFGENDSHAYFCDYDKKDLFKAIMK